MLDIGLSELLLIGVVAVLVLGPDKLPQAARSFARFRYNLQDKVSNIGKSIDQELGIDQLKQEIRNESILKQFPIDEETKNYLEQIARQDAVISSDTKSPAVHESKPSV